MSTTRPLQPNPLDPLFDADSAATFAETLSVQFPSRVPGSAGAADAAVWYRETVASLGLPTEDDVWEEDLADLGRVELRNVVTVVAGRSDDTIVLVAHRDNAGVEEARGENARGTAALIELARGFAPQEIGPDPLPQHTLVLVSTDGGAYGGAGAARFVETSRFARDAIAVVILDGLGNGPPRLGIAGDAPVSPARALVRTAAARMSEETRVDTALPSIPQQLVALAVPYSLQEQGRFLAGGLSAVTLGTRDGEESTQGSADSRLGQLGRATEALVGSLDRSVGAAYRTPDTLFVGDRAVSGWTLRLVLVLGIVPFALGLVDLIVRGRRRGLPFKPALRAQWSRLGVWMLAGALVWLGSALGAFPTGAELPLAPYASLVREPPILALVAMAVALLLVWLVVVRERLAPRDPPRADERLAGLVVGLCLAGLVAVALALLEPYALLFVLPALYAWLWLPLEGPAAARIALYALGLIGPAVALLVLADGLGLTAVDAALYVIGLATVGYLSPLTVILMLVWGATASQVGALAVGRYGPYAGGAEPAPPGLVSRVTRRAR